MSTGRKPSPDFTVPLLILIVIIYFAVVIPGVRAFRARYYEAPQGSKQSKPQGGTDYGHER